MQASGGREMAITSSLAGRDAAMISELPKIPFPGWSAARQDLPRDERRVVPNLASDLACKQACLNL